MIDDTKTESAEPNAKPAPAKSAKPAAAPAAAAKSEAPAAKAAQSGTAESAGKTPAAKAPDFVKAAPAVPSRNPLKPKPATPVVPVDRVRPSETKAASAKPETGKSETSKSETVAAPPAPVPVTPAPAPVATPAEPAARAKAVETATKPQAASAPTPKTPTPKTTARKTPAPEAPAPLETEAPPPVAAEAKPVVAAPAKPAPARTVTPAAKPAPRSTPKAASSEIIDIPAAFEAFRKPAEAVGEEWPKTFRTLAETGLDQTRDTYRRMRRSAERLGEGFEDGTKTAQTGLQEFQLRWFDAVRSQTDATLGFMKAMTEVRSLSDAIELNASHARLRFEEASAQAKDLAAVASRTLSKTGETVRKAMTESISPRG